eukprot:Pgem_evm1s19544
MNTLHQIILLIGVSILNIICVSLAQENQEIYCYFDHFVLTNGILKHNVTKEKNCHVIELSIDTHEEILNIESFDVDFFIGMDSLIMIFLDDDIYCSEILPFTDHKVPCVDQNGETLIDILEEQILTTSTESQQVTQTSASTSSTFIQETTIVQTPITTTTTTTTTTTITITSTITRTCDIFNDFNLNANGTISLISTKDYTVCHTLNLKFSSANNYKITSFENGFFDNVMVNVKKIDMRDNVAMCSNITAFNERYVSCIDNMFPVSYIYEPLDCGVEKFNVSNGLLGYRNDIDYRVCHKLIINNNDDDVDYYDIDSGALFYSINVRNITIQHDLTMNCQNMKPFNDYNITCSGVHKESVNFTETDTEYIVPILNKASSPSTCFVNEFQYVSGALLPTTAPSYDHSSCTSLSFAFKQQGNLNMEKPIKLFNFQFFDNFINVKKINLRNNYLLCDQITPFNDDIVECYDDFGKHHIRKDVQCFTNQFNINVDKVLTLADDSDVEFYNSCEVLEFDNNYNSDIFQFHAIDSLTTAALVNVKRINMKGNVMKCENIALFNSLDIVECYDDIGSHILTTDIVEVDFVSKGSAMSTIIPQFTDTLAPENTATTNSMSLLCTLLVVVSSLEFN